jgi:YidC/Oxa1 family membrane protein insertase
MENQRLFLWLALAFTAWLTWQAWQTDYHPGVADTALPPATQLTDPASGPVVDDDLPGLPETADVSATIEDPQQPQTRRPGKTVRIRTDVLDLAIDTLGADLNSASLPQYPQHKDQPDIKVQLLQPSGPEYFVFRTGLRAAGGAAEANQQSLFHTDQDEFVLADGQDILEVPLTWVSPDGLEVRKVYTLRRGSYAIDLRYEVRNRTDSEWQGASYVQIRRQFAALERSMVDVDTYSYRGPVIYDGDKYEKLDVDDLAEEALSQTAVDGWIAVIQHHFLVAAVPPGGEPASYAASHRNGIYSLSAIGNVRAIPAGGDGVFEQSLFIGPKLQGQLKETAPGLELTVDYGLLTIISQPLFWVLQKIHGVVGNWGWAIILLTVLIKLVFYKLSETSGKSMAKMRKLQPRIKSLQERYKDDRQALSQAMMSMYKREKVNPAAGCLPILVQMPVFLALYWVLLESVEMRQAPFILWIQDLSSKDPYFILPLLMGITMFIQQKLNPTPPDPVQAKVMMALPIVFTVFFAFFPAGLVLYWFTNNLLSIAQQWRINRVVEAGGA